MTRNEHTAQLAAVRASLSLVQNHTEARNVYPLRPACPCGRPGAHGKPAGCNPPRAAA